MGRRVSTRRRRRADQATEQAQRSIGYRIVAAGAPRMAARDSSERQQRSATGTMVLQRLQCIRRAGRLEATGAAEPGAEQQTISAHQRDQPTARKVDDGAEHGSAGLGRRLAADRSGQHRIELVARGVAQRVRRGALESCAIEWRTQANDPQSARQALLTVRRSADLALQQRARDSAPGVPLRHHGTEPNAAHGDRRRRVIHRDSRFRCSPC